MKTKNLAACSLLTFALLAITPESQAQHRHRSPWSTWNGQFQFRGPQENRQAQNRMEFQERVDKGTAGDGHATYFIYNYSCGTCIEIDGDGNIVDGSNTGNVSAEQYLINRQKNEPKRGSGK